MRKIHIIGGGTVAHIRPHLALCAPAYGSVVRHLFDAICAADFDGLVHLYTTKMAGGRHQVWQMRSGIEDMMPTDLETNEDVARLLDKIVADPDPSIVFLPAALCDFDVTALEPVATEGARFVGSVCIGKDHRRLSSSAGLKAVLTPTAKVISRVRKTRKDIFLIGFKTTTGAAKQEQFDAGLTLVKKASCNLVLANDLETKINMIVTPEQAPYHVSPQRRFVLRQLVNMALSRSQGHFTRSTVDADNRLVSWNAEMIPQSLRTVVNHCITRGAYKPFMGTTVGHFAVRVPVGSSQPPMFITSRRGVDFNKLDEVGMVTVVPEGDDKVVAWGAKPSVGGQSQRIIFAEHPDVDCIVHFHCPMRGNRNANLVHSPIPVHKQEPYECGSHECGQNTSDGLKVFEVYNGKHPIKAVMLDNHGPNIVFSKDVDPQVVINFIEKHWDLERSTREVL